jgi:molybdopterin synthase catalytic subunit
MLRTWITDAALDANAALAQAGTPQDGAVLLFAGSVRDENEGRAVSGMRYDAYTGMAERVLQEIGQETLAQWQLSQLVIAHRIGELEVGDTSVLIVLSSPHRAEAYAASRHVIEEIKRRLPVWKQERYVDQPERWLEGVTPPAAERTS